MISNKMNQTNNDPLSKAVINYVLESDNYCSYYPEINGKSFRLKNINKSE